MENCNHPQHKKILEEALKEDISKEIVESMANTYVDTKIYGKICVNCWSYEVDSFIEKNPIGR